MSNLDYGECCILERFETKNPRICTIKTNNCRRPRPLSALFKTHIQLQNESSSKAINKIVVNRDAVDTVTNFTTTVASLSTAGVESVHVVTDDYHLIRTLAVGRYAFATIPYMIRTNRLFCMAFTILNFCFLMCCGFAQDCLWQCWDPYTFHYTLCQYAHTHVEYG